jgi:hypothetical protein
MTQKSGVEQIEGVFTRLSAVMQTRLVSIAAEKLLKANQQRIAAQVDVNSVAFIARKSRKNKPMFARLLRNLKVLSLDSDGAVIGFTGNMGQVAEKHQTGVIESATLSKNTSSFNKPAELRQAVELIRLGFKVGKTKPSTSYIQSKYTISQAAHLIKKLKFARGESTTSKKQWAIKNEIRTLLGISEQDKQAILAEAITALNEEVSR